MNRHLDIDDPKYAEAAGEILNRHGSYGSESNITMAVSKFLAATGLADASEIELETSPTEGGLEKVDLAVRNTIFEVKRRIGTAAQSEPDPAHVRQLDNYLAQAKAAGKYHLGILTDGKNWLLRFPDHEDVRITAPYVFDLKSSDDWLGLFEWLRDNALEPQERVPADEANVRKRLGPESAGYELGVHRLTNLYENNKETETVKVKRQLWEQLLRAALGELGNMPDELDALFVRHTYLSAIIGLAIQASFGIDIRQLAENDPADLLQGRELRDATGLKGIVESDFFAWPAEVGGGHELLEAVAERVAPLDWHSAPPDIAATLYQTVIPADERRTLGEYYTPMWLAEAMVDELVTDPLNQRVLDPACGSGTFIVAAMQRFLAAAQESALGPNETLEQLQSSIIGIDVHPAAVHLARASWALAAREAVTAATDHHEIAAPIYLGDALRLRTRPGDLFDNHLITIETRETALGSPELRFPTSLVERAGTFDTLMAAISDAIARGHDPRLCLNDVGLTDPAEREEMERNIDKLQQLHSAGRNHIWAYYTRNMARPVLLSQPKHRVDVIIGNPPWINYNQTSHILREELKLQSKSRYGIWVGGQYATQQDVAGLFFARSVDLYLKDGGTIGMVLPHSALRGGQYSRWRQGRWEHRPFARGGRLSTRIQGILTVDFSSRIAWDLSELEPNDFFPQASCVVFAQRATAPASETAAPLSGTVQKWTGQTDTERVTRTRVVVSDTLVSGISPYQNHARNGATIFPRCLFFVETIANPTSIPAPGTITVKPRRGAQDKAPWRDLDLSSITEKTIEESHLFAVCLGETLLPYTTLEPLTALLPLTQGTQELPKSDTGVGGIDLGGLDRRMRGRWEIISNLWELNKVRANGFNLLEQLDYLSKLSSQLEWQANPGDRPVRIAYSGSGKPTAAVLDDSATVVENTTYCVYCKDINEANYLLAIVNSSVLYESVQLLMSRGQFGSRHLHKHLWKLPIPVFDDADSIHRKIASAGEAATQGAQERLASLRSERGTGLTSTIARRELRKWLAESDEGAAVENEVRRLRDENGNAVFR